MWINRKFTLTLKVAIALAMLFGVTNNSFGQSCTHTFSGHSASTTVSAGQIYCSTGEFSGGLTVASGGIVHLTHGHLAAGGAVAVQPGGQMVVCGSPITFYGTLSIAAGGEVVLTNGSHLVASGGSISAVGMKVTGGNKQPFAYQGDPSCYAQITINATTPGGGPNSAPFLQSTDGANALLSISNRIYTNGLAWGFSNGALGSAVSGTVPSACGSIGTCFPCGTATVGGSIASTATECSGSNSATLTLSGHTGAITKWQYSTDNWTTPVDVANTTTTLVYTNITTTTKYRAVVQNTSYCDEEYSSDVTITVDEATVAGSITADATVCTGSNSATLTLSGHTGDITKWQSSIDNWTTPVDIANTTTTQGYTNLTATTKYRAVIKSGVCAAANAAEVTITVSPTSVAGSIASDATVCSGTNSATLTLSGHTGLITNWESSTDNWTSTTNIVNATTTQGYTNIAATTKYRAVITSGACAATNGNEVTITVDPVSVGGTIATAATVCEGDNGATLTLSGHTGSITKWQSSIDNWTTPVDIANTTTTQAYSNLTATTKYRAVLTSGVCAAANSAEVEITVTPALNVQSITADQSICYNTNAAAFGSVTPTGGNGAGTYGYQWQISTTSAVAVFTDIGGATSETYTHGAALTQNTWFWRNVTSGGCGPDNTAAVAVTVYSDLTSGTVAAAQTISHGSTPSGLTETVAPTGGTGAYTYQWQSSADGGSFTDINSATSATYSPGALTVDTWYQRVTTSGACGSVTTNNVKITVLMYVCSGNSAPAINSSTGAGGGGGSYTYSWQSSTDGSTWVAVGGEASTTLSPSVISVDTWYRRGVSVTGCGPVYTASVKGTISTGSPGGIGTGLLVWLKADAGTGSIGTQWDDQSGNNNHYTTVTGPTVNSGDSTSNYNPYINITSGGFDAPAGTELGNDYTIIMVASKLSSDDDGRIFDGHSGDYCWGYHGQYTKALNTNGSPAAQASSPATTTGGTDKMLQSFVRSSAGTIVHYVNGVQVNSTTTGDANGIRVDINTGAYSGSEASDSRVYEFIVYNAALTTTELEVLESYLMTKYRLGNQVNYVSSLNAQTYDVSTYANDIIGIGKECYFHQKQSESADDSVKVYISTLAATNAANGGSVTNSISYLILGHDGGSLRGTSASNAEVPSPISNGYTVNSRLAREWKVTNTNFVDNYQIKLTVEDQTQIADFDDLCLLVDDDGDFTSGCVVYAAAEGVTFASGSIIINGLGPAIIPAGPPKFITIGTKEAASTLPVELIKFDASSKGSYNELTWTTAAEINNDYFVVEKSDDGINWEQIGRVAGSGNTTDLLDYSFNDYNLCNSTCYYRLKQFDFDGNSKLSSTVTLDYTEVTNSKINIYPNPTLTYATVEFEAPNTTTYSMSIISVHGQTVYQAKVVCVEGGNDFQIKTGQLAPGLYFVKMMDIEGREVGTKRFSKK